MILKDLIAELGKHDPSKRVKLGFHSPHSHRGNYHNLAFEPLHDTTIGGMLSCAESALGSTYQGWKGGDFIMNEYCDCWLANEGTVGQQIGPILLSFLLNDVS